MLQFCSKIAKLFLYIILPTIFISGTKIDSSVENRLLEENTIFLTGSLNDSLSASIDFESAIKTTSNGTPFSTLKLKLSKNHANLSHTMEFVISRKNSQQSLPTGSYKIARENEGLLKNFDGVFGFANISSLGELPLFAQEGEIQISHNDNKIIKGKIYIQMKNSTGNAVLVNGYFVATNEKIRCKNSNIEL